MDLVLIPFTYRFAELLFPFHEISAVVGSYE